MNGNANVHSSRAMHHRLAGPAARGNARRAMLSRAAVLAQAPCSSTMVGLGPVATAARVTVWAEAVWLRGMTRAAMAAVRVRGTRARACGCACAAAQWRTHRVAEPGAGLDQWAAAQAPEPGKFARGRRHHPSPPRDHRDRVRRPDRRAVGHIPSGRSGANSAWVLCAAIAHNLLRAPALWPAETSPKAAVRPCDANSSPSRPAWPDRNENPCCTCPPTGPGPSPGYDSGGPPAT